MLDTNLSHLADFVYPQSTIPPEDHEPEQNLDALVYGGNHASFNWEEYVRTARPAADQSPPGPLLIQSIEAPDTKLHLDQQQATSSEPSHNQNTSSHTDSAKQEDPDEILDMSTVDPKLFDENYDPRIFVKRSPS
ncbi:hypothetical protein F66182_9823 [Fusarium sp. NRRL 66182]|nr:hypothetical protein F66182_9823 [Fusarium sp. NRRL 66182]